MIRGESGKAMLSFYLACMIFMAEGGEHVITKRRTESSGVSFPFFLSFFLRAKMKKEGG